MTKHNHLKLAEFIEEEATEDIPWASAATAFVAMKKRASLECEPEVQGLPARAYELMEHMISEKLASQSLCLEQGLEKLAAADGAHAQYFLNKMRDADQHVHIRSVSLTKLAAMRERSITVMQHLCDELGGDPTRHTVEEFIREDVGYLPKLASLETVEQEKTASSSKKAVAITRVKDLVKKAQHSAISGGALRGPDPSGSRPRHEIRDNGQYTYHDNKDEGQPKSSKTASKNEGRKYTKSEAAKRNKARKKGGNIGALASIPVSWPGAALSGEQIGKGWRQGNKRRVALGTAAGLGFSALPLVGANIGSRVALSRHDKKTEGTKNAGDKVAVSGKWILDRTRAGLQKATSADRINKFKGNLATAHGRTRHKLDNLNEVTREARSAFPKSAPVHTSLARRVDKNMSKGKGLSEAMAEGRARGAKIRDLAERRISQTRTKRDVASLGISTHPRMFKKSALAVAKIMKLAAESGMSVKDYVGAEQQAKKEMEVNELEHVRQIAEQATQENQVLSERASQAEQQLQEMQQNLQLSQQQGQMSLQAASDSEANAAEQAGAKLRMKMKIDQMRQTLADLAAVNPQMDEAPGPEAGQPQPGAPAGPVQQQADAAQQAAQQPQTAEQAKQTQQAQTAQQKATQQTQQAQQAQQAPGSAQVPTAGVPGAPSVPTAGPATPAA